MSSQYGGGGGGGRGGSARRVPCTRRAPPGASPGRRGRAAGPAERRSVQNALCSVPPLLSGLTFSPRELADDPAIAACGPQLRAAHSNPQRFAGAACAMRPQLRNASPVETPPLGAGPHGGAEPAQGRPRRGLGPHGAPLGSRLPPLAPPSGAACRSLPAQTPRSALPPSRIPALPPPSRLLALSARAPAGVQRPAARAPGGASHAPR